MRCEITLVDRMLLPSHQWEVALPFGFFRDRCLPLFQNCFKHEKGCVGVRDSMAEWISCILHTHAFEGRQRKTKMTLRSKKKTRKGKKRSQRILLRFVPKFSYALATPLRSTRSSANRETLIRYSLTLSVQEQLGTAWTLCNSVGFLSLATISFPLILFRRLFFAHDRSHSRSSLVERRLSYRRGIIKVASTLLPVEAEHILLLLFSLRSLES